MTRWVTLLPVALLLAVGCEKAATRQTEHEALANVCNAVSRAGDASNRFDEQARRIATWIDANVTHPEIRSILKIAGPAERARALARRATQHGIHSCDALISPYAIELSETQGRALDEVLPTVTVSPVGVGVDSRWVLPLVDGRIPAGEIVRDRVLRIMELLSSRAGKRDLVIAVDQSTPYRTAAQVIISALRAGRGSIAVASRRAGQVVRVPLFGATESETEAGLKLVVSVTHRRVIVWSLSGRAGTLDSPLLDTELGPDAGRAVRTALERLVQAEFANDIRAGSDRRIVAILDSDLPVQHLFDLLDAVRFDARGHELFPHVDLGVSFD